MIRAILECRWSAFLVLLLEGFLQNGAFVAVDFFFGCI